ncbi:hypothetical protein [Nitrosopumilus adriaticus]|uniref:hypothetical protein n=1 Tax=Nitrosopumilus adriaticus TaxID=1580092 RepID=UPI00352FCB1A
MEENISDEPDISICDIMKNRTSEIVKKLENQLPLATQQSSDLYTAYLHSFDDVFGTCYISQKEFFDKLNIPQQNLKNFDKYLKHLSKSYQNWIELNSKLWYHYVQMRLSNIKSFDEFVHVTMDSYARTLARYNSIVDSINSQKEKD